MVTRGKLRSFKYEYLGLDKASLKRSLAIRLEYSAGKEPLTATLRDWFDTVAYAVRDRLTERWMDTMRSYYDQDAKRVYYLSLEFLIGRSLGNGLLNLGMTRACREALADVGLTLEQVAEMESEAGLGNGGLGRLAACFLDSMATLGLPGYGYGIRYEYGIFRQKVEAGRQVEHPDNWLRYANPWEFPRAEVLYPVRFGGRVIQFRDEAGRLSHRWVDTQDVWAMAYDMPIPGFGTRTVNHLRLWSAKASRDFDLGYFNQGNYIDAVAEKTASENISKVLYPSDSTDVGRELRLRQQYFFVSASLQDILRRFRKHHEDLRGLPDKVAIQLNDTHPAVAIPELMRLLLDREAMTWDAAWDITHRCFAYTNHTLLPEALETWPVALFERLLPRHLQIVYEINHRFLNEVGRRFPGDADLLRRVSLIAEEGERQVRMAHLACVGSHTVNGVAALHTRLMRETIFADFARLFPDRFVSITNGVTPRRWLAHANPGLAELLRKPIGGTWTTDLERLAGLAPHAEDAAFRADFRAVKHANKRRLAALMHRTLGIAVDPHSLFDVQVKRIHEYKRQLLNLLHAVTLYVRLREQPDLEVVPRTIVFAGKAAPGYALAKLVIRAINAVADTVNHDPRVADRLKVAFLPNYDVTLAETIIPAADLSEQISTAGQEASGTGNMKLALNGALTIGTLDGANVEIRDAVGEDNIFIFGLTADGARERLSAGYDPWHRYHADERLRTVLDMLGGGFFSPREPGLFRPLVERLTAGGDPYLVLADYADYVACQERVETLYRDQEDWTRRAILNVSAMGRFSSDRAIREYAERVWGVQPVRVTPRRAGTS
jgi:starch phosphorylase